MRKLLHANALRLRKSKCFWLGIVFCVLMGGSSPLLSYINMKTVQERYDASYIIHLDGGCFSIAVFIGIMAAIFAALFIGTEYSDGTMRNKIIVGRTRPAIYLANLLTVVGATTLWLVTYFACYLAVGVPLLGWFTLEITSILILTGMTFALAFASAAIFVLIAMLCQNKALSAILCILVAFGMLFVASFIQAILSQPETYMGYDLVDRGNGMMEEVEYTMDNPNYVRGWKRELYEFLADFIPAGQALQVTSLDVARPALLSVYSLLIFMLSTGAGIFFFHKKDLK